MIKINKKHIIIGSWLLVIGLLVYSRFVNLGWGLPYPMHPDERNMANAVQGLNCDLRSKILDLRSCFNPHFFAYGQFPLYAGYVLVLLMKFFDGDLGTPISFSEAAISLRVISALASIINVFVIFKIIKLIISNLKFQISNLNLKTQNFFVFFILIFSPFFIQFSHFGTTESLLMLFYSSVIFYSLKILDNTILNTKYLILTSLLSGLAVATKVSSIIFLVVPIITIMSKFKSQNSKAQVKSKNFKTFAFLLLTLVLLIAFSPHNLLNWPKFISVLRYEADVATGRTLVFYTRQFTDTIPIVFQIIKIFPYALGWPMFILGIFGFFGLSWRDKRINLLRLALIGYFLPNAFLFAKWTRFMAPIFPLMIMFAVLMLIKIKVIKVIKVIIVITAVLPGIVYLSIYQNPDVRFQASDWIYKNIPENSYILSETANVVDIPIPNYKLQITNYKIISFDFYDLDINPKLQEELKQHIELADYIIVPSRRMFSNHSKRQYLRITDYYNNLFSGNLGFKQIAEFSSYPKISLLGKTLLEFPDEQAEETWTVFDHPVIRIYKK